MTLKSHLVFSVALPLLGRLISQC